MLTFDLHYHANIHQMPGMQRRFRLRSIARILDASELDYLASTEHSYKKPLDAYLYLADAAAGGTTKIIPGVETVTAEGIDLIFLFRDEEQLRLSEREIGSFQRSIRDVKQIAQATGAISIIPHPFHICRSAAGNVLCRRSYVQLLRNCDYVEIHNGSALTMDRRLSTSKTLPLFRKTAEKLRRTIDLPMKDRGKSLGWSVGSDAHFPGEQFIVGRTDVPMLRGEHVHDFLRRRIRFRTHELLKPATDNSVNNYRLFRSLQSVLKEGARKELIKARRRALVMAAAMVCTSLSSS
ncbi:MAG: PHP domain-containing protein [Desulfovibrio sp.]